MNWVLTKTVQQCGFRRSAFNELGCNEVCSLKYVARIVFRRYLFDKLGFDEVGSSKSVRFRQSLLNKLCFGEVRATHFEICTKVFGELLCIVAGPLYRDRSRV